MYCQVVTVSRGFGRVVVSVAFMGALSRRVLSKCNGVVRKYILKSMVLIKKLIKKQGPKIMDFCAPLRPIPYFCIFEGVLKKCNMH